MLIMRSSEWNDLTTKARIRDAALARFPKSGFAATTIRAVAADAGVSPALVVHHFGSKEGLREACDHYVIEKYRETKLAAMDEENWGSAAFASSTFGIAQPLLRYFSWAMVREHAAAGDLFDEMVRESQEVAQVAVEKGLIRDSADRDTRTTVQMAMMLGMVALHAHVERNTGIDPTSAEGIARLTPSLLEIFSGVFEPETFEALVAGYAEVSSRTAPTR
jgi:AcrR family transcriptional regulator